MTYDPNPPVTVLIELGRVPEGHTVSKKTGTKQYRVVDWLKIYGDGRAGFRSLNALPGTRLMVDDKGVANAQPRDLLVHWHTNADRFDQHIRKAPATSNFLDQSKGAVSLAAMKALNDWADRMSNYNFNEDGSPDDLVDEVRKHPMRTSTASGKTLARDGWMQISRKYMVVGRLPMGSTPKSCLTDYAIRVLHMTDVHSWVANFTEASATDFWLRMNANNDENFLQLNSKQFDEFRKAGGTTAR